MPWCPRCDEVFPEGPACPRCSTRLVDRDRGTGAEELEAMPELATIKVSRRDRRALERLSGPKAPSGRVLAAAVAALVFAIGFLVGRLGSMESSGPSVRVLPPVKGLMPADVEGSAVYLLWTSEPLATVAVHDLYSGDVVPRARLSPPFDGIDDVQTSMASFRGSAALVARKGDRSLVAVAPAGGVAHAWLDGVEAAWASSEEVLVRDEGGSVTSWSVRDGALRSRPWGEAERLFQSPRGAVVLRSGRLMPSGGRPELSLPQGADVLGTDGAHAVLRESDGITLWDGRSSVPVRIEGFRALSASFEPVGDRVAVLLRRDDDLALAVVDHRGDAALKPLGIGLGRCEPTLSWDGPGRWIYVGAGDGSLHAVEAGGGQISSVRTKAVGCGLAWIN